jgi:hypothetical protein
MIIIPNPLIDPNIVRQKRYSPVRGGNWHYFHGFCCAAKRFNFYTEGDRRRNDKHGFRVLMRKKV